MFAQLSKALAITFVLVLVLSGSSCTGRPVIAPMHDAGPLVHSGGDLYRGINFDGGLGQRELPLTGLPPSRVTSPCQRITLAQVRGLWCDMAELMRSNRIVEVAVMLPAVFGSGCEDQHQVTL